MARREERAYREYVSDEQRSQPRGPRRGSRVGVEEGCPARELCDESLMSAMARNRLLLLALIPAWVMTGSVGAQTGWVLINHWLAGNHGASPASWMVRATDHFDIYYERRHERALDEIAREAERAYARVGFDLKHELAARVPLILVQTDRELPQDRRQAGELVRASGAPDRDHVLLALEPSDGRAVLLVH